MVTCGSIKLTNRVETKKRKKLKLTSTESNQTTKMDNRGIKEYTLNKMIKTKLRKVKRISIHISIKTWSLTCI